jgi:hypothetical protein
MLPRLRKNRFGKNQWHVRHNPKRRNSMKKLKKYLVGAIIAWCLLGLIAVAIKIAWSKCSDKGCCMPWWNSGKDSDSDGNGASGPTEKAWALVADALEAATSALHKALAMAGAARK